MSPTHDLGRALQCAAESRRPAVDPADDLARAMVAARIRTRRRFRTALVGVAGVAVLAAGAATVLDRDPARPGVAVPSARDVELVAETFDATPYTFDLTPKGWSVQAQRPTAVTIAPDDGSKSSEPDDFRGKLVILFDTNRPSGQPVRHDGRRFWVTGDSGYTTLATRSRYGEPAGVVRIQYPDGAGWDRESMVAFLASVHVGPGARHGFG